MDHVVCQEEMEKLDPWVHQESLWVCFLNYASCCLNNEIAKKLIEKNYSASLLTLLLVLNSCVCNFCSIFLQTKHINFIFSSTNPNGCMSLCMISSYEDAWRQVLDRKISNHHISLIAISLLMITRYPGDVTTRMLKLHIFKCRVCSQACYNVN